MVYRSGRDRYAAAAYSGPGTKTLTGAQPVASSPVAPRPRTETSRPSWAPTSPVPYGSIPGAHTTLDAGRTRDDAIARGATVDNGPGSGAISFYQQARLLYPWLPDELLRVFASAWEEYGGDETLAWAAMRQDPSYDRHFAGNRRADGTFRLTEQEYMATVQGYDAMFGRYGLNSNAFRHRFVGLIENEVSVAELADRMSLVYTGLVDRMDSVRSFYAENYGLDLSNEAIFASALDPEVTGNEILAGRITNAQIGGWARFYGFDAQSRNTQELQRIDQLRQLGATEQQARRVYQQAAMEVPRLGEFAQRYGDRRGFGVERFEDIGFLGRAETVRQRELLIGRERSAFSRATGFAQNREGAFSGLAAR